MEKNDIKNFTIDELKEEFRKFRIPTYRALQIFLWIYKKGVNSFEEMKNLPKDLQDRLNRLYYIGSSVLSEQYKSIDGTEKFLFKLQDGNFIESVLIYDRKRKTVCISTQVGCKYKCLFCASGSRGFIRNLTVSEILAQILYVKDVKQYRLTNFVFMGMGEPLDNYHNLVKAIIIMNSSEGLEIGARKVTISTCGIIPGIEKLKNLGIQVNLSISLHAANSKLRDSIVPVNKVYPLEDLIKSCQAYVKHTGRNITIEYVLIKEINDSSKDADELSSVAKRLRADVNLIPYSPVSHKKFITPSDEDITRFKKELVKKKVNVTIRNSKGKDIKAACGQLAVKH